LETCQAVKPKTLTPLSPRPHAHNNPKPHMKRKIQRGRRSKRAAENLYLAGILGDAADDSMTIRALLGAIVEVLDDDSLATGVAALQEHDHLVGLEELHHGAAMGKRRACTQRRETKRDGQRERELRAAETKKPQQPTLTLIF